MNIPVATYRLQFQPAFDFDSAGEAVGYMKDLGISHIYASPVLKAKKGSTHGYDVADPAEINPELGGKEKLLRLMEKAGSAGLFWLQDIVPNHMAFDSENSMLMDVFEKGAASPFFGFFDINWEHPYANLKGKALTPFLGDFYGNCLEKGEITCGIDRQGLFIKYYDLRLPLFLPEYPGIIETCIRLSGASGGVSPELSDKLDRILGLFRGLDLSGSEKIDEAKQVLWSSYSEDPGIKKAFDGFFAQLNGKKPQSLDLMHELISKQLFRLSFWKVGNDELNYRRFFAINSLICLNTEDPSVFDYIHRDIFDLADQGLIHGLRIDHIDGLYAPLIYLRRLREKLGDIYIVTEKILSKNEEIPANWPVQGTTGYDFLNHVNGLFIDSSAVSAVDKIYSSFTRANFAYSELVTEKKRLFIGRHMAGDIDNLAQLLKNILSSKRYGLDFTMYGLRRALAEVMAHFPVYRTYVSEIGIHDSDSFFIRQAVDKARRTGPDLWYELDIIEKLFLLDQELNLSEEEKEPCRHFVKRFQQFTGALMAKGVEDTAYYIYNRMISLNEVGGFPDRFGVTPEEFHEFNHKRSKDRPYSMNATSTHDGKRGEDARARINVLSEIAREWSAAVRSWNKLNRKYKTKVNKRFAPCNNDEYLIYQNLIGAFPFEREETDRFRERIKQYVIKAVREAKIHTAWLKPDTKYEDACVRFVEKILSSSHDNRFLAEFTAFEKKTAHFGIFNSISQLVIKLSSPGVPDIYQGAESWDLSLVDPDNRGPVDFAKRKKALDEIRSRESDLPGLIEELLAAREDGRIKLFTLYRGLSARSRFRELFREGEYIPLETKGAFSDNIIAFCRRHDDRFFLTAVPRFLTAITTEKGLPLGEQVWQDTVIILPVGFPGSWENIFTGQRLEQDRYISAGKAMDIFPAVLLAGKK